MIRKKISELTYEEVTKELGEKFCMHHDESDMLRSIGNGSAYEGAKEELMKKFGDVEVVVDSKAGFWGDKFRVVDEKFIEAQDKFNKEKARWCAKYGCD